MLVLSRKVGQEIVVGDNVRIIINKVSGNRVTLGVEAPDHVRILRGELEPIVCSFEQSKEVEDVQDDLTQTVVPMDEAAATIPFVPNVAR